MAKRASKENKTDIYKIITVIILTAIVVFALAAFAFKYYPEMKKENEVNAFYKILVCQVNCPLTPQFVPQTNRTEAVPDEICAQNCSASLIGNDFSNIKSDELLNDNFAVDVQNIFKECKSESQVYNSTVVGNAVNTAMYFACARSGLDALKESYSYLK